MSSIWKKCSAGHDLTAPDALLYLRGGNRVCKLCYFREKNKSTAHRHVF